MPSHTFRRFLFPALRTMLGSFLFVLTFSFVAFSETELLLSPDEKLWLAQHPELRLGVIASRLPFEALSSERKQEGIASDYAKWLEKTLGIRFVAKASLTCTSPPSKRPNRVKPCCSPGHTLSCPSCCS